MILLTTSCFTQSLNDTIIRLPAKVARKLYTDALQKDVLLEQVAILNQRISEKEAIITGLDEKDSINSQIIETYTNEISVMKDQRTIFETEIKAFKKALKKQRRKTVVVGILGIATTAVAFYIGSQ